MTNEHKKFANSHERVMCPLLITNWFMCQWHTSRYVQRRSWESNHDNILILDYIS